jgi:hypothetical protein
MAVKTNSDIEELSQALDRTQEHLRDVELEYQRSRTLGDKQRLTYFELLLQIMTYNYELGTTILIMRQQPKGSFSQRILLKEVVHKVYEWTEAMKNPKYSVIHRLIDLGRQRGLGTEETFTEVLRRLKQARKLAAGYRILRDNASGHYLSFERAYDEMQRLDLDEVIALASMILGGNMAVLFGIKDVGGFEPHNTQAILETVPTVNSSKDKDTDK